MSTESKTRFIAIHQFKPENETDLPLEKGQLVLGNFVEGDWWVGEDPATGRAGVFPTAFVAIEGSEAADECLRKLSKEDKEPDANIIISTDPNTGLKYSYNKQTMETKWLTSDEKNDSPIHLEIGDNDDDDDNSDLRSGSYKPTKKPLCGCHSFTIKMWLCFLAFLLYMLTMAFGPTQMPEFFGWYVMTLLPLFFLMWTYIFINYYVFPKFPRIKQMQTSENMFVNLGIDLVGLILSAIVCIPLAFCLPCLLFCKFLFVVRQKYSAKTRLLFMKLGLLLVVLCGLWIYCAVALYDSTSHMFCLTPRINASAPLPCDGSIFEMTEYPNVIDFKMPSSYVNQYTNHEYIYSVSSLEYKLHAKAPMEMFDNSTGLFLGSLDFFPYYGRCSAPGAPFAGEAWLQLSNAKGSKRVTSADRAMRTSLFQPWMEFNILNTCDGIDATGNVINQNGYLWQIVVQAGFGRGCARTFEIYKKKINEWNGGWIKVASMVASDTIVSEPKELEPGLGQKFYTMFNQPIQMLTMIEEKTKKELFTLTYDFGNKYDKGEYGIRAKMRLEIDPLNNAIPNYVHVFAAGVYQANLVENSLRSVLKNKYSRSIPQVPVECGGPATMFGEVEEDPDDP